MIYLFEDRTERLKKYSAMLLKNSSVIGVKKFTPEGDLMQYIVDNFSDATVFIMHASYRIPGYEYGITDIISGLQIIPDVSIVFFSGGIQRSSLSVGGNIYRLNSNTMYNNLPFFLKAMQTSDNAPIETLIWGEHYVRNQYLSLLWEIHKLGLKLSLNDTIDSYQALELVEDKLRVKDLKDARDTLIAYIESEGDGISYLHLVRAVESLMHQYPR